MRTLGLCSHTRLGLLLCSSGLTPTPGEESPREGGHTAGSVRLAHFCPPASASLPGPQLPPRPCAPEQQKRTKAPGEAGSPLPWAAGGRRPVFSLRLGYRAAGGRRGPELLRAPRLLWPTVLSKPTPKTTGTPSVFTGRRWAPLQYQVRNSSPFSRLLMAFSSAKRPTRHRLRVWTEDPVGGSGAYERAVLENSRQHGEERACPLRVGNSAAPHRTQTTGVPFFGVTAGP